MSGKPTYEEPRQRIKNPEESAGTGGGVEELLRESKNIRQRSAQ
jgi:hypothetical protein